MTDSNSSTASVLVKFCGMTRREDAVAAADLGAAAVGFVLWSRSKRAVTPEQVRDIVRALPPFIATVGVFVDESIERVKEIVAFAGLTAAQLHGRETAAMATAAAAAGVRVIKALGEPGVDLVGEASRWPAEVTLLIDAVDPRERGGTGHVADWDGAAAVAKTRRIILAGGLNPDNVADAIARVRPYAVDVVSGVEARPGVKDHARMAAFFDAVRDASHRNRIHQNQDDRHGNNALTH
jgi:phosphoribosylanthranilate isomerase